MTTASHAWYVAEGERAERLLDQGRADAARRVFEAMLARLGDAPSYPRAVVLGRLGRCWQIAGRLDLAEETLRQAFDVAGALAPSDGVTSLRATLRSELGDALRARGRYDEARDAYEAALQSARERNDARAAAVELGRLGALAAAQGDTHAALTHFESARRFFEHVGDAPQLARCLDALGNLLAAAAVPTRPELARYAPVMFATLGRLGAAPTYGRAVMLGHLGRCWHVIGRPDLAVQSVRDALGVVAVLPAGDDVTSLRALLSLDLGDMLYGLDRHAEARGAYEAALAAADALQDMRGRAVASQRLGRPADDPHRDDDSPVHVVLYDDVAVDHVFDPDLLIEGPRQRRVGHPAEEQAPAHVRPMLMPAVRTWVDERGAVWFNLPFREPDVQRDPGCTVLRRSRREVQVVAADAEVLWRVIRAMDGATTVTDILSGFSGEARRVAARLLDALAAARIVDVSGRPLGRFVHLATKKGVLPAGGLEGEGILRLAADGRYRAYPDAPRVTLQSDVPDRLRAFYALTRSRRSSRAYGGAAVARSDFDAILHTACGITGTLSAAEGEVQLRAYPSSGALYAVEIYPVVFRVEELEPAVYHYRASDHVLEVVRPVVDPATLVRAALPVEREMVAGAAALICLTGRFSRHERKYGEGGYRMLVAEAGHISQNLVLAATALGLKARPFGGVFDDLLNEDLELDGSDEQFLLAVLVGVA